jgi:D-glycero-D-manno-heptose 1,7-bisphosphate phosphatase
VRSPAVFLDRDGVLNRAVVVEGRPHPPGALEDLELEEGAAEACALLAASSVPLVVFTNQPDVTRGQARRDAVDAINAALLKMLPLTAIYTCFHDDADDCPCRKPRPGLLHDAARDLDLDLDRSVAVGDRWRDVEAGRAAGCATVFIDHGYAERRPQSPDLVAASLLESVSWIVRRIGTGAARGAGSS